MFSWQNEVAHIQAAFRRLLYHPDLAPAHAYVFTDFLNIPCAGIFGGRSVPSLSCVSVEMRSYHCSHKTILRCVGAGSGGGRPPTY
jgi:hypothetical protein